MCYRLLTVLILSAITMVATGCKSTTPPPQTGFLSTYDNLETIEEHKMRFVSQDLADYDSFIVDHVQLRMQSESDLSDEQRAEAARYFREQFINVLTRNGYMVADSAAVGTARVRLALTDIQDAEWWMNLHPGSKLTGAGTGGASMEGEVIDSVTGVQLAAVVKSGRGDQFELDTFSELDDIKDVIDDWAEEAEERLRELRESRGR